MGVSWHNGDSDPQFIKQSNELWHGGVNWATATSYNAISAIGTAINATGTPSRQMVQRNLSSLKFPGAAGNFQIPNSQHFHLEAVQNGLIQALLWHNRVPQGLKVATHVQPLKSNHRNLNRPFGFSLDGHNESRNRNGQHRQFVDAQPLFNF
ncbi:MAG: hypothetical protein HC778_05825 [Chamaesiphon sp. CSU_1_12]|nr:hypothetical protein [Chamaesiphon sp. CSU_1_12]